ncbi:MAG: hypothetical protein ACRDQA_01815 [Nocardioidaceae bacterium]
MTTKTGTTVWADKFGNWWASVPLSGSAARDARKARSAIHEQLAERSGDPSTIVVRVKLDHATNDAAIYRERMGAKRKTAYTTRVIEPSLEGDGAHYPNIGSTACLVECRDLLTGDRWNVLDIDPRTNMSYENRWHGWLGATDGVSRTARGGWRVVSVKLNWGDSRLDWLERTARIRLAQEG